MKTYLTMMVLALSAVTAQAASMADVVAADAQIAAAKEARKLALKGLTKLQRAELRVAVATIALAKARESDGKKERQ